MSSYRFCRTDDIGLLCEAYERCYRVHFPSAPPLDPPGFKRLIREQNLWCSSCMVTFAGSGPVGVMLATKREDETLIWAIGVREEEQRREHGSHMLRSLSAKLAILGPPRLVVELPDDLADRDGVHAFLSASGYGDEAAAADWCRPADAAQPFEAPLVQPLSVEEFDAAGLLACGPRRPWSRSAQTVRNIADRVEGLAIPSFEGFGAWALWERPGEPEGDGCLRLLRLGAATGEQGEALCGLLVRQLASGGRTLRLDRATEAELPAKTLQRLGFVRRAGARVLAATARPA